MGTGENIEIITGTTVIEKTMLQDIKRILPKGTFAMVSEELLEDEEPAMLTKLKKTTPINQHTRRDSPCQRPI